MDEMKVIIPRNEPVFVRDGEILFAELEEGETLVDIGNFRNCVKPFYDGTDFIDVETEQEKANRLASVTPCKIPLTTDQVIDVLDWCGVWPL